MARANSKKHKAGAYLKNSHAAAVNQVNWRHDQPTTRQHDADSSKQRSDEAGEENGRQHVCALTCTQRDSETREPQCGRQCKKLSKPATQRELSTRHDCKACRSHHHADPRKTRDRLAQENPTQQGGKERCRGQDEESVRNGRKFHCQDEACKGHRQTQAANDRWQARPDEDLFGSESVTDHQP